MLMDAYECQMLLIFWVVTPLVSAVFATRDAIQSSQRPAKIEAALLPLDRQVAELSNGYLISAYKYLWAGEPLPPFTTEKGALIPFTLESRLSPRPKDANWTASTTMLSAHLTCNPASIVDTDEGRIYDNGKGCAASANNYREGIDSELSALYVGYWTSQFNDYYLSGNLGCNATSNQHVSMGFWNNPKDEKKDVTVLFCEPFYTQQKVKATVLSSNLTVLQVEALEDPFPLSPQDFNFTNFEYISSTNSPARSRRADINDTSIGLSQRARLKDAMGLKLTTMTSIMEYALATTRLPLSNYSDPSILSSSFEKANQLLFAYAAHSLLYKKESLEQYSGEESFRTRVVVVIRPFAIAVESALGVVVIATATLMFLYRKRPSEMTEDPSSIEDVMKMLYPLRWKSGYADSRPKGVFGVTVQLRKGKLYIHEAATVRSSNVDEEMHTTPFEGRKDGVSSLSPPGFGERPWEMRSVVGCGFVMLLCGATATIVLLDMLVSKRQGLSKPSKSEILNQLLTNYLPVMFATFLEPFWTLLNRVLCVLQPLEALRTGDSPVSKSLALRYSSLPPQLSFWRALRARHWLLVSVCFVGISTNILTVALGGLLVDERFKLASATRFPRSYQPVFQQVFNVTNITRDVDNTYGTDPGIFPVVSSSILNPNLLVPWTTNDTFFVPFEIPTTQYRDLNQTNKASTQGFGVQVLCDAVEYDTKGFIANGMNGKRYPQVMIEGGGVCNCTGDMGGGQNKSKAAMEFFSPLSSSGSNQPPDGCEDLFLAGFLRANLTVSMDVFKTDNAMDSPTLLNINSFDSTWAICRHSLIATNYEVEVDASGRVKTATQMGGNIDDKTQFFTPNLNQTYFMNQTREVYAQKYGASSHYWRNDTFTDTWFGYLVKSISRDPRIIDPASAAPRFEEVAPLVEDAWKRVFVTQLSLNRHWLAPSDRGMTVPGSIISEENRLSVSRPAFILSLILLSVNIVVALAYYLGRPGLVLPRLPITLGRIMELFDGSGLLEEAQSREGIANDCKVGYGRFVGTDGKPHVGIERKPFVLPFKLKA